MLSAKRLVTLALASTLALAGPATAGDPMPIDAHARIVARTLDGETVFDGRVPLKHNLVRVMSGEDGLWVESSSGGQVVAPACVATLMGGSEEAALLANFAFGNGEPFTRSFFSFGEIVFDDPGSSEEYRGFFLWEDDRMETAISETDPFRPTGRMEEVSWRAEVSDRVFPKSDDRDVWARISARFDVRLDARKGERAEEMAFLITVTVDDQEGAAARALVEPDACQVKAAER